MFILVPRILKSRNSLLDKNLMETYTMKKKCALISKEFGIKISFILKDKLNFVCTCGHCGLLLHMYALCYVHSGLAYLSPRLYNISLQCKHPKICLTAYLALLRFFLLFRKIQKEIYRCINHILPTVPQNPRTSYPCPAITQYLLALSP